MKLLQIRYEHLSNIDNWEKAVFEKMAKLNPKKYNNFKGFIVRKVYTTKTKIITYAYPLNGLPAEEFRKAVKKAGLIGMDFSQSKSSGGKK